MSDKLYTEEQMREAWNAGSFAMGTRLVLNITGHDRSGPKEFDEYIATLTPEPSADVVERCRSWLEDGAYSIIKGANTYEHAAEVICEFFDPIITAEVERRVSGYREALEAARVHLKWEQDCKVHVGRKGAEEGRLLGMIDNALAKGANTTTNTAPIPQHHDPDDWPEPGMEEKR